MVKGFEEVLSHDGMNSEAVNAQIAKGVEEHKSWGQLVRATASAMGTINDRNVELMESRKKYEEEKALRVAAEAKIASYQQQEAQKVQSSERFVPKYHFQPASSAASGPVVAPLAAAPAPAAAPAVEETTKEVAGHASAAEAEHQRLLYLSEKMKSAGGFLERPVKRTKV